MNENPEARSKGDELVPLSVIERLLSPEFNPGSSEKQRPSFLVGRLPENLPVEIPVPNGASIIGSRPHGDDPRAEVEVVLDVDTTAEQSRETYRELMARTGWSESDRHRGPMGSGFVSEAPPDVLLFCKSDRGPALFVRARDRKDAPTDVRLSLVPNERYSPCSPRDYQARMLFEPILPPLAPPPGARLFPRSEGGSDDDVESNAVLQTDLHLGAVGTHYVAHLKDAGWSLLNEGGAGPQTWSTWSFSDETGQPWSGLFTALRLPDTPQELLLRLWARRSPAPVPDAGRA